MQFVGTARKRAQLLGGLRAAGRFAEQPLAEAECLVGANDIFAHLARRHRKRFLAGQKCGDVARRCEAGSLLHGPLINVSGNSFEGNAGGGQQHLPRAALRRKYQLVFAAPQRHSASRCRCRSPYSFRIAAAVSSIDRRVTSSSAQLNLALKRRANATSSVTAWRSM